MGFSIDWPGSVIQITSPTVSVDLQTLHDFIEDQMATPVGVLNGDIIQPEGKIEDPTNPGVFSQIIVVLNTPWQVQFWGGSGYSTVFGGKLIGGLSDEPIKATGTAGDITVLNSPVDGITVVTGSALTTAQDTRLKELHQEKGLESGSPMTVTPSSRAAGSWSQTVTGDGETTTTVTRDP